MNKEIKFHLDEILRLAKEIEKEAQEMREIPFLLKK